MTDNEIIRVLNHIVGLYAKDLTTICGIRLVTLLGYALDLINRQKAEIINRTEEYNDMLHQRNKVEEALELKTMDVNSLESERDALQEMVKEQKAEVERLRKG